LCCLVTHLRLLDSSRELTDNVASVQLLESIYADKSLLCRLNLSFRLLMNYILLTTAGDDFTVYSNALHSFLSHGSFPWRNG